MTENISRDSRKPIVRVYIDNPFELSDYEGDVNDGRTEFWCKKCNCPAVVEIDPRDGEVETIACPKVGAAHFHVEYVPLDQTLEDEDESAWEDIGDEDWDAELDRLLSENPIHWSDIPESILRTLWPPDGPKN